MRRHGFEVDGAVEARVSWTVAVAVVTAMAGPGVGMGRVHGVEFLIGERHRVRVHVNWELVWMRVERHRDGVS